MASDGFESYPHRDAAQSHAHAYLLPAIDRILAEAAPQTVFDLGCGNGSVARHLSTRYQVAGIDYSKQGIEQARAASPELRLEHGSAYDDLARIHGQFDCVLSLEVVEHLFNPRLFARRMFDLVKPEGMAVVSTPYHGYWKNLALAASGKLDAHFTTLWDGGHVKFWSIKTLDVLLTEAGFVDIRFDRVAPVDRISITRARSRPIRENLTETPSWRRAAARRRSCPASARGVRGQSVGRDISSTPSFSTTRRSEAVPRQTLPDRARRISAPPTKSVSISPSMASRLFRA
jgi:2-polyprenyl-6-hydroxyphenyl methylase/3-demethylubiquinone-9 3-methyltransferase